MNKDRLLTLDAMRGLAAVVVLLYHSFGRFKGHGYLAVDFFFLLSGFVIARAYRPRLLAGMTLTDFAVLRVIRLYPLFALGVSIGLVAEIVFGVGTFLTGPQLAVSAVLNGLLVPSPATSGFLFPLNPPAWSLFLELAVNVLYAGALVRASTRALSVCATLAASVLLWFGLAHGNLDIGSAWDSLLPGAVRTFFGFTVGVIIARASRAGNRESGLSVALMVVLVVVLSVPTTRAGYDLVVCMVVSPLIVWFGAAFAPPAWARKASEVLGDISYALYATHAPIAWLFALAAARLGVDGRVWLPAFMIFMLVGAWHVHRHWDTPLRRRLNALWKARRSAAVGFG